MSRTALIVTLIVAGEMVFGLPFNIPRFFRPTMLDVFGLSFTELGIMFAHYGVVAIIAYYPGGALADRYSARSLMTVSLLATAVGGLYMATFPDYAGMKWLFAYWGATTVFLFWGALISATRAWGGENSQGVAFGVLDGGRGLLAFVVGAVGVATLGALMPDDPSTAGDEVRRSAFKAVILIYTGMAVVAAVMTWLFVPSTARGKGHNPFQGMWVVLQRPVVWAQAIIIICAYCGFKGSDNYSAYFEQVLGMNEVEAAGLANKAALLRPVAAVAAGLVADRFGVARSIGGFFLILLLAFMPLSAIAPSGAFIAVIYANVFISYFAVFSLRGVYFALLEENRTPIRYTGAAVGLVSVVGYTPDFFFGLLTGPILDAEPRLLAFQNYFLVLAGISAVGIIAVLGLLWLRRRGDAALWPLAAREIKA